MCYLSLPLFPLPLKNSCSYSTNFQMHNSPFFFGRLAKAIWFMHIPRFILVNRFYFIFWVDPDSLNIHCFFDAYCGSWNSPSCLHIIKEVGGLSLGSCQYTISEKLSRELRIILVCLWEKAVQEQAVNLDTQGEEGMQRRKLWFWLGRHIQQWREQQAATWNEVVFW